MTDDIKSAVTHYLVTEVLPGTAPEELTESTPLISGGILDSLATLNLVQFLENRFHVELQAHEVSVDYLDTTADIAKLVSSKLSQQ